MWSAPHYELAGKYAIDDDLSKKAADDAEASGALAEPQRDSG